MISIKQITSTPHWYFTCLLYQHGAVAALFFCSINGKHTCEHNQDIFKWEQRGLHFSSRAYEPCAALMLIHSESRGLKDFLTLDSTLARMTSWPSMTGMTWRGTSWVSTAAHGHASSSTPPWLTSPSSFSRTRRRTSTATTTALWFTSSVSLRQLVKLLDIW